MSASSSALGCRIGIDFAIESNRFNTFGVKLYRVEVEINYPCNKCVRESVSIHSFAPAAPVCVAIYKIFLRIAAVLFGKTFCLFDV